MEEVRLLKDSYRHLTATKLGTLKTLLTLVHTGEMEPQYIVRYGFYQGHTFWRTDPISISLIFGMKSLAEIEEVFGGRLYEVLTDHFTE